MERKYRQLTLDERVTIEIQLDAGQSFREIGRMLGCSPTTVSREVRRHITVRPRKEVKNAGCLHKAKGDCPVVRGCHLRACFRKTCMGCDTGCGPACSGFEACDCLVRDRPPHVCNGCGRKTYCSYEKHYYKAGNADETAAKVRSESRKGFDLKEEDRRRLGELVKPLVKDGGFSPHAVISVLGIEAVGCTERCLYNYVEGGVFDDVISLDLPRKVRYKPRKGEKKPLKVDRACRLGRTLEDYKAFIAGKGWTESDAPVVEMDTVEGRKGTDDHCLLTLHFVRQKFQLAYDRERNTSASVTDWFRRLAGILGKEDFKRLFPVILTDNGTEFSDPAAIEFDTETGERLTWVFYCDSRQSQQKGACENNHEMIRRVIPKGSELSFPQEKVQVMMDNINSYPRRILNDRTPYDMFAFMFGEDVLSRLGAKRIEPSKVILKPSLLKD